MIGADVPAEQRPQVGDAVDAAGVALLADDQDGEHRGERLGDDREVDATDPPLEHAKLRMNAKERRHSDDGDQRERQRLERDPEERQLR